MELSKDKKIGLSVVVVIIIVAIAATLYLKVTSTSHINKETKNIFVGSSESATYVDVHGNPVRLDEYLGKILVVNSFASWSPFSADDLKNLNELGKSYSEEEVVFLAINRKESKEQVQRYVATLPEYKHIRFVIDQEDRFYLSVGGYAMPETLIFDEDGTIVEHMRGSVIVDTVAATINKLKESP